VPIGTQDRSCDWIGLSGRLSLRILDGSRHDRAVVTPAAEGVALSARAARRLRLFLSRATVHSAPPTATDVQPRRSPVTWAESPSPPTVPTSDLGGPVRGARDSLLLHPFTGSVGVPQNAPVAPDASCGPRGGTDPAPKPVDRASPLTTPDVVPPISHHLPRRPAGHTVGAHRGRAAGRVAAGVRLVHESAVLDTCGRPCRRVRG
jgi:hypothetical protein